MKKETKKKQPQKITQNFQEVPISTFSYTDGVKNVALSSPSLEVDVLADIAQTFIPIKSESKTPLVYCQ